MATGTIKRENLVQYVDLGAITATSNSDAIKKAWDALTIYDKTVVGNYNYNGQWMFTAYKYTGAQYGMMMAVCYNPSFAPWLLNVSGGTKTIRAFNTTNA